MATLASVARERKQQLRQLMTASLRLDAEQEKLEREIKRIVARKRGVPELADAERLAVMAQSIEGALGNMTTVIDAVARSWSSL